MKRWEEAMLAFGWIVLLGGLSWMMLDKPTINAFVPAELTTEVIDKVFAENASLAIDAPLIKTLLVWGEIEGEGHVTVLLVNEQDSLVVYTNKPRTGLESITGMVTAADARFVEGACVQTCLVPASARAGKHQLRVEVDPGTTFHIKKISYVTA